MKVSKAKIMNATQTNTEYEKFNISDKYCVFRATTTTFVNKTVTFNGKDAIIPETQNIHISSGVAVQKEYNKAIKAGNQPAEVRVSLYSDKQLEIMAQFGWNLIGYNDRLGRTGRLYNGKGKKGYTEYKPNTKIRDMFMEAQDYDNDKGCIFEYLQDNPEKIDNLIVEHWDSHEMYFLLSDKMVPLAIHIDYIGHNVHNKKYDLKKALEILKARGNVMILSENGYGAFEDINAIPYYNAVGGRHSYIEAIVGLTKEEAEVIDLAQKELAKTDKYPSTKKELIIWDNDLFGLKEAAYNKEDFYPMCEEE